MAEKGEEEKEIVVLDGFDNQGDEYETIEEFWALTDERDWYYVLDKYWKNKKANIDDMLGGMKKEIHKIDIQTSNQIVKTYWPRNNTNNKKKKKKKKADKQIVKNEEYYALDCGAGIGRVTEFVLGLRFDKVDLIEINPDFCKACKERIGHKEYFGDVMAKSLHEFIPKHNYYHCIWCQWTLEHLSDDDLITFLKNCKKALNKSSKYSYCVFKENVCRNNLFFVNISASSIIRHQTVLEGMFEESGLNVVKVLDQKGFPQDLWPQKIFILN